MINASAIASTGLVHGSDAGEKMRRILDFFSVFPGRELQVDEAVYRSEIGQGVRGTGSRRFVLRVVPARLRQRRLRRCAGGRDQTGRRARKAEHSTPELLSREWRKLRRDVALVVVHINPAFYGAVTEELSALNLPTLQIGQPGKTYEF